MYRSAACAAAVCLTLGLFVVREGLAGCAIVQSTSATIEGRLRGENRQAVDGALVRFVDRATGYAYQTLSQDGHFFIGGLRVGGPYLLTIQHPAYATARHDNIFLTVAEHRRIEVGLTVAAHTLDTLHVVIPVTSTIHTLRAGVATTISDSLLRRLPSSDRNYYEFALLSPHTSGRSIRAGMSGGGVSVRLNNFLLDGVSERGLLGNFAAGTGQAAKAIPVEAVKEYQVLVSPYDVRYNDFVGALVNAVTKSGDNELAGSVFLYARNNSLARNTELLRTAPYERAHMGFTLSGPLVRSRAHFFLASEIQQLTSPAPGPYFSELTSNEIGQLVTSLAVSRFTSILQDYDIDAGSAGRVQIGNPLRNVFGKIDIAVPELSTRLVLFANYARADNIVFTRTSAASVLTRPSPSFPLSSLGYTNRVDKLVTALQLYSNLGNAAANEMTMAVKSQPSSSRPVGLAPMISVRVPRADGVGTVFLEAGSNEAAHGVGVEQRSFEIMDHLTLTPHAAHRVGLGARVEFFKSQAQGQAGAYGSWMFSSLDSLAAGAAERFRVVKFAEAEATRGYFTQVGIYASDEWRVAERLSFTFGLRLDLLKYPDAPPYNELVDTLFERRNTDMPNPIHWSPRVGFSWLIGRDRSPHLRGGVGLFAGRPGTGWLGIPLTNHGHGAGLLECGSRRTDRGPTPSFVPDYRQAPQACANGSGTSAGFGGAVSLVDHNLRLGEAFKASLAYDHNLPWNTTATLEALYTSNTSDFLYVDLNLGNAQGTDRTGRVLYGSIDSLGVATRTTVTNRFSEVIELRNQSRNHSFQIIGRLDKRFSQRLELMTSYTFSRVRDVQSLPHTFSYSDNWRFGRVISQQHDNLATGISSYDVPNRVVIAGTYTAPWQRWATDISFYYIGESGMPFTYIAALAPGKGDLNADGTNLNDPIYVPRSAADTGEIRFYGDSGQIEMQQQVFEQLIQQTDCLRRQRGLIMARNSCRTPWVNVVNASVRQSLPAFRGNVASLQLEIFNVLNLLNRRWGQVETLKTPPNPALLEHMGQTPGPSAQSQPVFRYDPTRRHIDSENVESAYQLQLGLHFRF